MAWTCYIFVQTKGCKCCHGYSNLSGQLWARHQRMPWSLIILIQVKEGTRWILHLPIWQMLFSFSFGAAKRKTAIGCIIHLMFSIILSLFWFSPVNFTLLQSLLVIVSRSIFTSIEITNKRILMHGGDAFAYFFLCEELLKIWWIDGITSLMLFAPLVT